MTHKSTGIKKHAFSSAAQLKDRNLQNSSLDSDDYKKIMGIGRSTVLSLPSPRQSLSPFPSKAGEGLNGKLSKEIELNRRYFIVGERRISSYWWASVFLVGGFGFLITGISSYIKYNLFTSVYVSFKNIVDAFLSSFGDRSASEVGQNSQIFLTPFFPPLVGNGGMEGTGGESLVFFPQGLLLCFYGSLGLLLSLYWWLLIYWNVGGGFNEFNKKEGFMRIFRWGYPGKNRRIDIVYPLTDIEAIRVELNQTPGSGLLTAEQTIFIRLLSTPSDSEKELTTSSSLVLEKNPNFNPLQSKEGGKREVKGTLKGIGVAKQGTTRAVEKLKREIPLGGIGQPLTLKEIEKQASELANYLQVALEGL